MSPETDVAEMEIICGDLADRLAVGTGAKARIKAVADALGIGWNRSLELLRGKARRVDGYEKDHARRKLEELKEAELRRTTESRLAWLRSTVEHLRQTDEEFHRFDVDGLERAVSRMGALGGPVGDPETSD
jgi:hypothetical protein